MNPDGTPRDRRTNAHGVDLNRNFPYNWHAGSSGLTWSGPAALRAGEPGAAQVRAPALDPSLIVTFHQPLFGVGANDTAMPWSRDRRRDEAAGATIPLHRRLLRHVHQLGQPPHRGPRGDGRVRPPGPSWRITRAARTVVDVGADLV